MTKERRTAPDPEWVQMYRTGIPSPKIAAGAGVAESTVRSHLHLAAQEDTGLPDAHKAALSAVTRTTSAGLRNLHDAVAFYEAEGGRSAAFRRCEAARRQWSAPLRK